MRAAMREAGGGDALRVRESTKQHTTVKSRWRAVSLDAPPRDELASAGRHDLRRAARKVEAFAACASVLRVSRRLRNDGPRGGACVRRDLLGRGRPIGRLRLDPVRRTAGDTCALICVEARAGEQALAASERRLGDERPWKPWLSRSAIPHRRCPEYRASATLQPARSTSAERAAPDGDDDDGRR